ncbi:VWA domain-containing protein [Cytophagaceae bacterium ABcell3]|nr:VWA domain-containing protein [Cytophagaceae bacterium ABcell3]
MEKLQIVTEYSLWFASLCLLAGFGYAYLLYPKKAPWGSGVNKILFTLRFVLVSVLCLLLLGPLAKMIKNHPEKPTVVFAIDDSESIIDGTDSTILQNFKENLVELEQALGTKDIETKFYFLSGSKNNLSENSFTAQATDLTKLLRNIQSDYENRNLSAVVLASDGIINQGMSPTHSSWRFPIHAIGLGDTNARKDLNLKALFYNKVAYAGNKFPIVAELHNTGFKGKDANVTLKQNGKVLGQKKVTFDKETGVQEVKFYTSSETHGIQHYVVETDVLDGEFTAKNNVSHAYIDIIEGREKILILAAAPHPDIKAIRSALETKANYQVEVHIPGLKKFKDEKYDLVIYHQLPDKRNTAADLINKLQGKTSSLFIIGSQTNLQKFNQLNKVLTVHSNSWQRDQVLAVFNKAFDRFSFNNNEPEVFAKYPPLAVPYANYSTKNNPDVLFHQKIGNLKTQKPLILVDKGEGDHKFGVIAGEGIWQWRMTEFTETGNFKAFDHMLASLTKYLSSKEDKRRFRFYPLSDQFLTTDRILFETEIYNSIYEKVYGKKIDISITNEEEITNTYSFVNSEANSVFEVKGLGEGIYKYTATLNDGDKKEKVHGEFLIEKVSLEALDMTANHAMLRNLASQTSGTFALPSDLSSVKETLLGKQTKSIIHSTEELSEIINQWWLLLVLLLIISVEWGTRKFKGGY